MLVPLSFSFAPWFWLPLHFTGYPVLFPHFQRTIEENLPGTCVFLLCTGLQEKNIWEETIAKVGFSSFQSYCIKFSFSAESSVVYVIIFIVFSSYPSPYHILYLSFPRLVLLFSFLTSNHPIWKSLYTLIKRASRTIWIGGMANSQIALKAHVFLFHVWSPLPTSIIFHPFMQRKSQTSVLQRVVGYFHFFAFFLNLWSYPLFFNMYVSVICFLGCFILDS